MSNQVLIVDDLKENIDILMFSLKDYYSVMAARSGEAAIKLMERKQPDLVLLDVTMPGMDGFAVLAQMKQSEKLSNIPVIFITAEHDPRNEEKGLTLGAVDYIHKPFNTAVVYAKVRNHLELKKYRDGLEFLVLERTRQLMASREAIIMGMSLLSESRDRVTGRHIERIKAYTRILTTDIMEKQPHLLTPRQAEMIVLFSPLHDVGKVSVPDHILNKPSRLSLEEMDVMKTHTVAGADVLRKTELFMTDESITEDLDIAIEITQYHHERFDGTGYPHKKKADEIPLSARIVALPDVYDALRSPRPYKEAFTHQEAVDIILKGDDRTLPEHFDPMVLEIFGRLHKEFDEIYHRQTQAGLVI